MMALNRYRLRHLAESGHLGARYARRLLAQPDRLLGTILLGNNFANIAASSVSTILALKIYGEAAIAVAAFLLTLVILVFAEVAPKTLAAHHPERIAFPAAFVLIALLRGLYPLVWIINAISNRLLLAFGVNFKKKLESLNAEELRIAVMESGSLIPETHQSMLLRILDLEGMTVDDVMVSRSDIEAINIEDEWEVIVNQLATSHHTRLPVYRGSLDNVIGIIHLRRVLHLSQTQGLNKEGLLSHMREPYFIPEGAQLSQQLLNLQNERRTFGLVVDEYGDVKGLVTVEEILEEIVGEFTRRTPGFDDEIRAQDDGTYLVRGTVHIRELNRKLDWSLPTDGPKTLNGLILEYLEAIPEPGTSLLLGGHPVEIVRTRGTAVTVAKVDPRDVGRATTSGSERAVN